jgi:hypothetical protein
VNRPGVEERIPTNVAEAINCQIPNRHLTLPSIGEKKESQISLLWSNKNGFPSSRHIFVSIFCVHGIDVYVVWCLSLMSSVSSVADPNAWVERFWNRKEEGSWK